MFQMPRVRKYRAFRSSRRERGEDVYDEYEEWYRPWGLEQERMKIKDTRYDDMRRAIDKLWEQVPIKIAGLAIFRIKEGSDVSTVEWLLLQTWFITRTWSPPKGHLELGEDEMEAALRETQEETGLKPNQLTVWSDICEKRRFYRRDQLVTTTLFLARLNDYNQKILLSSEHQDHKWLRIEDAEIALWYPQMIRIFRRFQCFVTNEMFPNVL